MQGGLIALMPVAHTTACVVILGYAEHLWQQETLKHVFDYHK